MSAQYRQATLDYLRQQSIGTAAQQQQLVDCSDATFDATVSSLFSTNATVMAISQGQAVPSSDISTVNEGGGVVNQVYTPQ